MTVITEFYRRYKKVIDRLAIYIGFVLLVYLFVKVLFGYIAPFAVGLLLALLLEPLVSRLCVRMKVSRGILAFLSILLVIFIIGVVGTVIMVRIINEARSFAEVLPQQMESLTQQFTSLQTNYTNIIDLIPVELRSTADNIGSAILTSLTGTASTFVRSLSTSVVKIVPGTFVGVILCFISMFFFIKDHDLIMDILLRRSPPALVRNYNAVKKGLFSALAGYLRAQAVLMSITAVIALTGLLLLRYPYTLFLGLLIAFFDFLPVFGPGFILGPWSLFSVITGNYHMAIALMIIYGVITLTRQLFEPKVLGSQIGIHPLVTLMSMFVGLKVFGLLGFLIGPFIVITIKTLNKAEV